MGCSTCVSCLPPMRGYVQIFHPLHNFSTNCGLDTQPPLVENEMNWHLHTDSFSVSAHVVIWLRGRHKRAKHQQLVMERNSHMMIMLLMSGIELNPGPRVPRFPCVVCFKACKANQMAVACDNCDHWTHKDCVSMSTASYLSDLVTAGCTS